MVLRPLALVDGGTRLTCELRLVDETSPTRRARFTGVLGAEAWVKLVVPGDALGFCDRGCVMERCRPVGALLIRFG